MPHRDVICEAVLSPTEHVDKAVQGCHLATKQALTTFVLRSFHPTDVIDGHGWGTVTAGKRR